MFLRSLVLEDSSNHGFWYLHIWEKKLNDDKSQKKKKIEILRK